MAIKIGPFDTDIKKIYYMPPGGGSPIEISAVKMWDGGPVDILGTSTTTGW